jgi:hypothetical protein
MTCSEDRKREEGMPSLHTPPSREIELDYCSQQCRKLRYTMSLQATQMAEEFHTTKWSILFSICVKVAVLVMNWSWEFNLEDDH